MPTRYDAIVIGAGQSGPFLAARFAKAGMRTALIEREHLGGTCVNDGCIPTKTLVASARAAHVVRHAAAYGVDAGGRVRVDMRAVKARKDAVVDQSVANLTAWLGGIADLSVLRGHGRFVGARQVRVGDAELEAERIFINVGGRAIVPDIAGLGKVPHLTNTSMMDVDFVPDHLIVVGGSYIGLEFAQMYRRFGSEVTVIEAAPRLIAREDPEVSAGVRDILEREGLAIHVGAADLALARDPVGVRAAFATPAGAQRVVGSHLLLAIGRRPNTDDLGLETAGVEVDKRGYIVVDDELSTNVAGIWALGDVNGRGAFTHTSYNDFEIVAANLLDGGSRRVSDRVTAYALYIDPPLARVGMSEAEVRATGRPARVATLPMARVGRARERGETDGFMKVLVDARTGHILGAALLGIEADEVVQQLLLAMSADLPYTRIQRTMGIHPTVSELLPSLFDGLQPLPSNPTP
jgi:pyruvate/2-oxoglutarate dehydrogenase complex dihydrolipoamide dehydrogenase (E3) component